jgi:hypothetical protein
MALVFIVWIGRRLVIGRCKSKSLRMRCFTRMVGWLFQWKWVCTWQIRTQIWGSQLQARLNLVREEVLASEAPRLVKDVEALDLGPDHSSLFMYFGNFYGTSVAPALLSSPFQKFKEATSSLLNHHLHITDPNGSKSHTYSAFHLKATRQTLSAPKNYPQKLFALSLPPETSRCVVYAEETCARQRRSSL